MRVSITGGAGFIGSHTADRLLAHGHSVQVLDNYSTGRRENLMPSPRLDLREGDIADADFVARAYDAFAPEVVLHAAASYKDPEAWVEDARTNMLGSAVVVTEARRVGVRRLIYLQSALCYGEPEEQPITIEHPIRPGPSSYAMSKTGGEYWVLASGLDPVVFRLANAYGPRNLSGPVPTFFQRLAAGRPCFVADTRRDFIFVQDLVDILEMAMGGRGATGAYNVASGSDVSIRELYDTVRSAMGLEPHPDVEVRPRSPGDMATILLDPSETTRDFDTIPSTRLSEGIPAAVAWYREHEVTETFTHLRHEEQASDRAQ